MHADGRSALAAAQLQARAFTFGKDIFLGARESAADLALMAHESTHVVQQGAVEVFRLTEASVPRSAWRPSVSPGYWMHPAVSP